MSTTSDEIKHAVRSPLVDDRRLPFHDEIAVEAYDGLVTLRGTVGSFAQERAAVADHCVVQVEDGYVLRLPRPGEVRARAAGRRRVLA